MLPSRLSPILRRIQSLSRSPMSPDQSLSGRHASNDLRAADDKHQEPDSRRPKKLIFAPGDIAATPDLKINATETSDPSSAGQSTSTSSPPIEPPTTTGTGTPTRSPPRLPSHPQHQHLESLRSETSTPTSTSETQLLTHPARAHQFITNPPLTITQLHPSNPLHYFHTWFRDPRLPASSAPETCTLATASLPSGRVHARVVYLKELDERGFVVYSNWGSREGKGGQVFGDYYADGHGDDGSDGLGAMPVPGEEGQLEEEVAKSQGNKWAALTFCWTSVERQVRVEGLLEPLPREESEMYWRTRERGSQIGAWASWQSRVLWSSDQGSLVQARRKSQHTEALAQAQDTPDMAESEPDDGRAVLEQRVKDMQTRFADTEKIPLPPFWGGVRLVPESVEFWQGRRSRLHDRFRYVRGENGWRVERLSP